jgi:taurine dioxygenase
MSLAIKNLNAPLGAEISGLDLSKPIAPNEARTIEDVWCERLVVVFHDQKLSDPQLIAFSKNFGELDPPGPNPYGEPFLKDHPELNVISNVVENGKPIGNLGDGEAVWHADMTYVEVPPKAAMLHSLEVPPPEAGGNTYFANMFAPTKLACGVEGGCKGQDRGA